MARITPEEVKAIADLARLSLSENELAGLSQDLDSVLDYVALLSELDTRDVEPTAQVVPTARALRADEAGESLAPAVALANAPVAEDSAFVVPKVIEEES